ncbi:MGA protein, partial [Penelope pileata]|nr:MGA protein [Penelope pileata]
PQDELLMNVTHNGYTDPHDLKFEEIRILGLAQRPVEVTVLQGGVVQSSAHNVTFRPTEKVTLITGLQLPLGASFALRWVLGSADTEKFDCDPGVGATQERCELRGCTWAEDTSPLDVPYCYYSSPDNNYTISDLKFTAWGLEANVVLNGGTQDSSNQESSSQDSTQQGSSTQRSTQQGSSNNDSSTQRSSTQRSTTPIGTLRLEVIHHTDELLQFKIYDYANERYEVPVPLNLPSSPSSSVERRLYDVGVQGRPFGVQVRRRDTGTVIWDSQLPTFTFSDAFLQISTRLPSSFLYGFGETEHSQFHRDLGWHTWGIFARDQPPGYKLNSYGSHPFYMALEEDGNAHGVLLLNSNGMDVTFQPTPALTYRTIGGILDFYIVLGPTPEAVVQQYTALVGRPVMPPYWALGFQLCRYGYESDAEIAQLVEDMKAAGIPYDVQYTDIDYMERQMDFTLSPHFTGLPALVDKIRGEGLRFIPILDPAIAANETDYPAFTRGVQQDVFIKWPNSNDIIFGKVWPDLPNVVVNDSLDWDTQVELFRAHAAFPDFFRNSTVAWWWAELQELYQSLKYDGLWIDMNEPASFVHGAVGGCRDSELNYPPYMP